MPAETRNASAGDAGVAEFVKALGRADIQQITQNRQENLAVAVIAARFGLLLPTARLVVELAGLGRRAAA